MKSVPELTVTISPTQPMGILAYAVRGIMFLRDFMACCTTNARAHCRCNTLEKGDDTDRLVYGERSLRNVPGTADLSYKIRPQDIFI